jgi:hypothetical protein
MITDVGLIQRAKMVATLRPRGALSGFLSIGPEGSMYVQREKSLRIRMRVSPEAHGTVLSAYLDASRLTLVLEDVVVWKGQSVWKTPFEERWRLMAAFLKEWTQDKALQGLAIECAKYMPLGSLSMKNKNEPDAVVEFVPNEGKRMIYVPLKKVHSSLSLSPSPSLSISPLSSSAPASASASASASSSVYSVRKEPVGPDVFSVWRDGERLGLALVRTLAISRCLRGVEETPVSVEWNAQFGKYEILNVLPS